MKIIFLLEAMERLHGYVRHANWRQSPLVVTAGVLFHFIRCAAAIAPILQAVFASQEMLSRCGIFQAVNSGELESTLPGTLFVALAVTCVSVSVVAVLRLLALIAPFARHRFRSRLAYQLRAANIGNGAGGSEIRRPPILGLETVEPLLWAWHVFWVQYMQQLQEEVLEQRQTFQQGEENGAIAGGRIYFLAPADVVESVALGAVLVCAAYWGITIIAGFSVASHWHDIAPDGIRANPTPLFERLKVAELPASASSAATLATIVALCGAFIAYPYLAVHPNLQHTFMSVGSVMLLSLSLLVAVDAKVEALTDLQHTLDSATQQTGMIQAAAIAAVIAGGGASPRVRRRAGIVQQ